MSLPVFVQVLRGDDLISQVVLDGAKKVNKIGKAVNAEVRVDDPSVSRVHAILELSPTGVTLVDMGSAAGTLVDGARINRVQLNGGEQITVGACVIVVSLGAPAPVRAPAPPTGPSQSIVQPTLPTTRPAASSGPASQGWAGQTRPAVAAVPSPGAEPAFDGLPGPGSFDAGDSLSSADPILLRMKAVNRTRNLIAVGLVLGGAALVGLLASMSGNKKGEATPPDASKPAVAESPEKTGAAPAIAPIGPDGGDSVTAAPAAGPAPSDPAGPEATKAASAAFDSAEPRDPERYLYHSLEAESSLAELAERFYGSAGRVGLLVAANPKNNGPADRVPAGTEIRAPRFSEYVVKSGDTLDKIAAAQAGSKDAAAAILSVNADLAKNPDALEVGMRLRIPLLKNPAP